MKIPNRSSASLLLKAITETKYLGFVACFWSSLALTHLTQNYPWVLDTSLACSTIWIVSLVAPPLVLLLTTVGVPVGIQSYRSRR